MDFHRRVQLGKIYNKLPQEFDDMSSLEFDLLYIHTLQLQEKETREMEEKQIKTSGE